MALIVLIVVVSGVLTGLVVTAFSIRNAAQERRNTLEYAGGVVAASVMPVVADQDPDRIRAQLRSILTVTDDYAIECIEIIDASGVVIAETESGCTCDSIVAGTSVLGVFTEPQVVRVPIEIDDLLLATVSIQFIPVGLESALWEPLRATGMIATVILVVAAFWGAWVSMRSVVEPIARLRDGAAVIAGGGRDLRLDEGRRDEIGDLERAVDDMTVQLVAHEQELRESYKSLERAFSSQAQLAEQLERALGVKSDFVAVASHELRSPLAVLQLYTEMLDDHEFGEIEAPIADALVSIGSATKRLTAIVSSLMDVALLERGLMPIEFADVDLRLIVEQAASEIMMAAAKSDITVICDEDMPDVEIRADGVRLRQVIDNLLSNAIKYSPPGSWVHVHMRREDHDVVIDVADNGRGVQLARREILFELFGRADAEDNAEVPGLGLGLSIASRIVHAHGGSIEFSDNPVGKGTIFTVRLPFDGVSTDTESATVIVV
ncbi:MAG: HAMP domain-containing sensor histidine kinase [Actinomycetota bacterium]|nr:HAMP domain-containing sensor histidine kinase [Actinomycetota bacterium]